MIDCDHELPLTRQAELLGISRGALYDLPQPVSAADLALMHRIDPLYLEHPFMGRACCAIRCSVKALPSGVSTSRR